MAPNSILVATFTGRSAGSGPSATPSSSTERDQGEVGGDLLGRGAAEELLPLPQLDLHHLGQLRVLLQHLKWSRTSRRSLATASGSSAIAFRTRATNPAIFSRNSVTRISSLVLK